MTSLMKKLTLAVAAIAMLTISPISMTGENMARADSGYYGYRNWRGDNWRGRGWRGDWGRYRRVPPYVYPPVYDPYYYQPAYQPYSFGYVPWYEIYSVPGVGRR